MNLIVDEVGFVPFERVGAFRWLTFRAADWSSFRAAYALSFVALAFKAINAFFASIRAQCGFASLRPISATTTLWRMDYLEDDGARPPKREELINGKRRGGYNLLVPGLSATAWGALTINDQQFCREGERLPRG